MSFGRDDNCPVFFCRREQVYRLRWGQRKLEPIYVWSIWTNITRRVPIYLRNCVLGNTYLCDIWNRARVEREREQVHNYYSKVSYSADMIYYSVNCLSSVTWVGENLVRNGAIWWNGIPVSCPIFSLWTSVCISTVVIRSIVDHFLYFVNVYPRLLCVMH